MTHRQECRNEYTTDGVRHQCDSAIGTEADSEKEAFDSFKRAGWSLVKSRGWFCSLCVGGLRVDTRKPKKGK